MDAFEAVVAALLVRRGYWGQTSMKLELTKEEKVAIGRHWVGCSVVEYGLLLRRSQGKLLHVGA